MAVATFAANAVTLANISASQTSVTLQAANVDRRGWSCWNDSTSNLFIKFGAVASSTSNTVKLASDSFYEMPEPVYTGIVDGIWTTANGAARVTETT